MIRRSKIIACILAFAFLGPAQPALADEYQPTYWTIKPQEMDDFPLAKVAIIGGKTFPDAAYGVHLQLVDVEVTQPIDLCLVSKSKKPLDLIVFKTEPSEPLLQTKTDDQGVAKLDFRADGPVYIRILGPEDADYELLTVLGPKIEPQPRNNVVTWTEFEKRRPGKSKPATLELEQEPTLATVQQSNESNSSSWGTVIVVLLSLIFVAIVVLVGVLLKRPQTAAVAIVIAGAVLSSQNVAVADPPRNMRTPRYFGGREEFQKKIAPSLVSRTSLSEPSTSFLNRSQTGWKNVNSAMGTGKKMVDTADLLARYLKSQYGHIDPKSAACQPNYNPRGKPVMPSSYLQRRKTLPNVDDAALYGEYLDLSERIDAAHRHLENNYVVRKNTEYEVGIIHEMANAAAGLSPLAQIAWARIKTNPKEGMNKSAVHFYEKYDGGQDTGLDYLQKALIEMGEFEAEYYGVDDWYVRHGMPFNQFMSMRYVRADP